MKEAQIFNKFLWRWWDLNRRVEKERNNQNLKLHIEGMDQSKFRSGDEKTEALT